MMAGSDDEDEPKQDQADKATVESSQAAEKEESGSDSDAIDDEATGG